MNRTLTMYGVHCDYRVRFELHPRKDEHVGYIRMTVEGATPRAVEDSLPLGFDLGFYDIAAIVRVLADKSEGESGENALASWKVGKSTDGDGKPVYSFTVRSKKANVLSSRPSNTAFIDAIAAEGLYLVLVQCLSLVVFGLPELALSGVASVT